MKNSSFWWKHQIKLNETTWNKKNAIFSHNYSITYFLTEGAKFKPRGAIAPPSTPPSCAYDP
jgi:hypothetical protein